MPQIGEVIADKYRLEKVAGEGGMGVVYLAEHLVLKQHVAVKVLLPDAVSSESTVERFAREARTAAKINSEHVARVLDAGSTASGSPFLVMEFLDGCDLAELLALQKTLPVEEVVDYTMQALEGLAHAHAAGIIHRDLKPANMFLTLLPDGSNAIKVLDFGISKQTDSKPEDKKLTGQHVLGSPVYMSPEQLRNSADIDGRADIWSIGVVMYEMLTGNPPFDGEGVGEIFAAILENEPVPLADKNPAVPRELSDVVMRCLKRQPDERWRNVGRLMRALAPFASAAMRAKIERAEQILARSQQLKSLTDPNARRIVDAIDAAELRAKLTRTGLALNEGTTEREVPPPAGASPWRSPPRIAAVGGVAVALVLLGTVGVVRATHREKPVPVATAPEAPRPTVAEAPPRPPESAGAASSDEPAVLELPASPSTDRPQSHSTKAKGGKPQRPKFLNSRE